MKRTIPLMLLGGLLSLAFVACGGGDNEPVGAGQPASPSPVPRAPTAEPADNGVTGGGQEQGGTEVFITLQDPSGSGSYAFDPADSTFSVGDTVTFVLESETEFHTFTVEELGINVSTPGGATQETTFTFDTAGTFKLICIPHQALGMVGTITVQ